MSADILGTSWDQCRSTVQYSFTSTETTRLVRTDSPGRPPRLSHISWTMIFLTSVLRVLFFSLSWGCHYRRGGKQYSKHWRGGHQVLENFRLTALGHLVPCEQSNGRREAGWLAFLCHFRCLLATGLRGISVGAVYALRRSILCIRGGSQYYQSVDEKKKKIWNKNDC